MLLSAGAIIKRSIDVYKANWGSIMRYVGLMMLFIFGVAVLFVVGLVSTIGMSILSLSRSGGDPFQSAMSASSIGLIVLLILFWIFVVILGTWFQIAMSRTIRRGVLNETKISIAEEMKSSRPFIWRTLGSSILVGLIAVLPFVIGIIGGMVVFLNFLGGKSFGTPSALNFLFAIFAIYGILHLIYFAIRFAFTSMAIMFDGKKVMEGLSVSTALVRGRWWSILWRTFAPMLLLLLPYYILAGMTRVEGNVGMLFAFMAFAFNIFVLIPMAGIPGVVLYENAKESSHPSAPLQS